MSARHTGTPEHTHSLQVDCLVPRRATNLFCAFVKLVVGDYLLAAAMQLLSAKRHCNGVIVRVNHDFEKILMKHLGQFLALYPHNSCSAFFGS